MKAEGRIDLSPRKIEVVRHTSHKGGGRQVQSLQLSVGDRRVRLSVAVPDPERLMADLEAAIRWLEEER